MTKPNLHLVAQAATPTLADRGERAAVLRAKVLRRACFDSQLDAAIHFGIGVRSVQRWELGQCKVPGWWLMALEELADERGVVIAERRAA